MNNLHVEGGGLLTVIQKDMEIANAVRPQSQPALSVFTNCTVLCTALYYTAASKDFPFLENEPPPRSS